MKRRLNILSILVFIVLGLSLYTTGYQFGTGMKAGMSLAKEQHKESKACDRPMLAGDFRFVDVVPTIAMIKPDTIINAQNNEKVPVMYTQMAVRTGKEVNYSYLIISSSCSLMNALLTISALIIFVMLILSINKSQIFEWKNVRRLRWLGSLLIMSFVFYLIPQVVNYWGLKEVFALEHYIIAPLALQTTDLLLGLELAEKIDITPANLSILKTGKAKAIRFSTLEAICKVLDCQPADILEYQEEICD